MSVTLSIFNQQNGQEINSRQIPAGGSIRICGYVTGLSGIAEPWISCSCDIQRGGLNLFHDEARTGAVPFLNLGQVEFNGFTVPEGNGSAEIIVTAHYPTGSDDTVTIPVAWGESRPGPLPGPQTLESSIAGLVVLLGLAAIGVYAFMHWRRQ